MASSERKSRFSMVNRYLPSGDAIVYNVTKLPDGWTVSARVPANASPSDRMKVIDWFHGYRLEVKRGNPRWMANFHVEGNRYILEIRPTHDIRQLAQAGEKVREIWDNTLNYAEG